MSKTGISLFSALTAHFRSTARKTATYTVLATDERIQANGTFTSTLPVISTFVGSTASKKLYSFENVSNYTNNYQATIAAGTGNTIGGRANIVLKPGEKMVISTTETDTDWEILYPSPLAPGIRNFVTLVAETSDTTAINVIDASGCPVVGTIVSVVSYALNATAANILVKNTNGTVCTIAKGTSAGAAVSATDLTTPTMAVGDLLTVESSATNGTSRVEIVLSTQQMIASGSVSI
jgi:hypothetical protein